MNPGKYHALERWKSKRTRRRTRTGQTTFHPSRNELDSILKRDNRHCGYCGKYATHVDHIVPIWENGTSHPDNLTAACRTCNLSKGASTDVRWYELLLTHGSPRPRRKARILVSKKRATLN